MRQNLLYIDSTQKPFEPLVEIARGTAVYAEPVPFKKRGKPPYRLRDGQPTYRLRLWLDPDLAYMPVRMECQAVAWDADQGAPFFLAKQILEWTEPVEPQPGINMASRAVMRWFTSYPQVRDNQDPENWPLKNYEDIVREFRFSNIRVNEPIPPGLFIIAPPPATFVIDRISGFRYVVGSAGEELEKSALELIDSASAAKNSTLSRRILAYSTVTVIGLASTLAYILMRRRRGPA
jgi:hypothetical protein